ncbi:MAG: EAL domain-containing response regulator [Gammaproteobacteria bacterium]|nr:EAL domain-containing response regulator [Gammaproteobacteria bacterium]MDH5653513.1 EAL domain-containing response regulator [Gammaproteobacteria bacterium]
MARAEPTSPFSNALVIDDSKSFLDYFTIVLNSVGITDVVTAISGRKALDALDLRGDFELILCDINMPEMDGVEFLRHLSDRNFRGEVVVISGEHRRVIDSVFTLAKAHQLNIRGTLRKPIALEQLQAMLTEPTLDNIQTSSTVQHEFSVAEIRRALKLEQFLAFYQPKVNVKSRHINGAEALCRWQHPEFGLVGADAFIPFMEAHDLMDDITDLMIDQAIQFAHEMSRQQTNFAVSVNISVDCLNRLNLPDNLHARVIEGGIRPENLIIEVTEGRLVSNYKQALEILTRMRLKGFGLSIDDFGTGYSSLKQLQKFPFQELKIDKTFITGAGQNRAAHAIIETSVNLANKLDMQIVAEGAETREDWNYVAANGIDMVQGFVVSRAMAPAGFTAWYDLHGGCINLDTITARQKINY